MYVKQISVFIENTKGKLADFTKLLADNNIDLVSLSIADTTSFGILRGIVGDYERTVQIIEEAGYTACLTDVLVVAVPDVPGGLANVLSYLSDGDIAVEYLYSFVRQKGGNALIVCRVEEIGKAHQILTAHQIKTLAQEDICRLA